MGKLYRGAALLLVLAVVFFVVHHYWPRKSIQTTAADVLDFDTFQARLAEQVTNKFGGGPANKHFSVAVVPMNFEVGTLFNDHDWIPVSATDCLPKPTPETRSAGHLFPSYSVSTATALQASLGSEALQKVTNATAGVSHSASFNYSIDEVAATIMDDESVDQVTGSGPCGKYIASHPGARLVRGALSGKITFVVSVDNPASFKAQFSKIGDVSIVDDPGQQKVAVSDKQSEQIVVLLTQFEPSPDGSAQLVQHVVTPAHTQDPASVDVVAHIYVQQDAAGAPEAGAQLVATLKSAWPKAKVETKVERIPTQKMPTAAQVRFFNASDLELANKCRNFLKATNLDANVVRVGLPAPAHQLEVWLPKEQEPTVAQLSLHP